MQKPLSSRSIAFVVAGAACLVPPRSDAAPFVEPDVQVLYTTHAENPGDDYGWAAERIGDLDGDGAAEFLVSAPNFGGFAGKVYVHSGATGAVLATFTGPAPNSRLGQGVAGGGDFDADGTPDYVIGMPPFRFTGRAGEVWLVSGATHQILRKIVGQPRDILGFDVNVAGDVNGDGYDDVIAGAPTTNTTQPLAGRVYVFSGRDGSVLWTFDGQRNTGLLGTAVTGLRDVNGDGVPDQAVGAQNEVRVIGRGQIRGGTGYVLDGRTGTVLFQLKPSGTASFFGTFFIHDAGDVDADGVGDVFAGDVGDVRQAGAGRAYVWSGATGERLRTINGDDPGEGLGIGRGAGDVDGDGHDDLLLGAWLNSTAASQAGQCLLVSGKNGRTLRTFTATTPGAQVGFDTVPLGDVTGDGLADYLLTGAGLAYVVAGTPLAPSSAPLESVTAEDTVDSHPVHLDRIGGDLDKLGDRRLR